MSQIQTSAPAGATTKKSYAASYKAALIASLAGILYGFDSGVIAGAIGNLTKHFDLTPGQVGFCVSSVVVGFMIGALSGSYMTDKLGRKKCLAITAVATTIAAIGCAIAPSYAFLLVFRILGGLGVGLGSSTAPMYIGEVSAQEVRGKLLGFWQMMVAGGMCLVYIVNLIVASLSTDPAWMEHTSWRWMLGAMLIPAALLLVLLKFVPESPRWFFQKGRDQEGRKVLIEVNGADADIDGLEKEIKDSFNNADGTKKSSVSMFSGKYRRVTFAVLATALLSNLCGINAIMYYGNVLFENIGIATEQTAYYQQVVIGVAFFAAAVWAVFNVEKYGRRKLLILGALVCAASILILGVMIFMQIVSMSMMIPMVIYILFFGGTVGPLLWVIIPELSPNEIRYKLVSVATFLVWFGSFLVSQLFPMMTASESLNNTFHGAFPFFLFGICCFLWFLVTYFFVPETKGKSLEEISAEVTRG